LIPLKSFRRNLSEWNLSELFLQNRNLSEWNLSEGIFQKIILAKPESFRMKSFRKNLSENMFYKNWNLSELNLLEGIIQKRLFEPTIGS
jgi:hypothetical protein